MPTPLIVSIVAALLLVLPASSQGSPGDLEGLGRALFFDTRLSARGSQSCATCHDPARAFADGRDNGVDGAASIGDDGVSLGRRNAPALTYAFLGPEFARHADGEYVGGFFLDGRAATLRDQPRHPLVSPIEMGLPDTAALRDRLLGNPAYSAAFRNLLGAEALATPSRSVASIGIAISAFESSTEFATFDSRYDRFLRGELELAAEEELGRRLFFSELVNCSRCHLADPRENQPREPFTNYGYRNIGVPANPALRGQPAAPDAGLLENPSVVDPAQAGKFRVPSLRNVAVTAPYMHNGVFRGLETAVHFYNQFVVDNAASGINPDTGAPWGDPEVAATVDHDLLRMGQPLTGEHVAWLVAFLEALTDARYEHLVRR